MATLLEIEDLQTHFFTSAGTVKAVDGVSYTVDEGETVAVVGESGCGKSVTAMSILRLIPWPPGKITNGKINFDGQDLLQLTEEEGAAVDRLAEMGFDKHEAAQVFLTACACTALSFAMFPGISGL